MYSTILIDLDNTILDFETAEKDSFKKVIESVGLNYNEELLSQYKIINNGLWSALEKGEVTKEVVLNTRFSRFFELYDLTVDGQETEQYFRSHLDNSSALIPNAKDTLNELKRMGKKVYSASNGVYSTQIKRLSNAGILDLFDGHFISEKINYEKPSPQFFEFCIKNLCTTQKSSMLMVGDSPTADILGAVNAGIDACFYNRNKNSQCNYAKYTIDDISQLIDLV